MIAKKCRRCGIMRPLHCYHKNSRAKDGRHNECKMCRNREYITEEEYLVPWEDLKYFEQREIHDKGLTPRLSCTCCGRTKPYTDFHYNRREEQWGRFYRQGHCKDCKKLYSERRKKQRAFAQRMKDRSFWAKFGMEPPPPKEQAENNIKR